MKSGAAHHPSQTPATLRDYLSVVRRRKWIILQAIVIVPVVAGVLASRQPVSYQASADVLLSAQNLAAVLAGTPDQSAALTPDTQAALARVPQVAQGVLRQLHLTDRSPGEFLGESSVTSQSATSDILTFSVTDANASLAPRLATAYAQQYTVYRRQLDTASLLSARKLVDNRMAQMQAAGTASGALYQNLAEKDQQLQTMIALQGSNATVVRTASGAARLGPHTLRDAMLGLILGLGIGLGLAFLREGLDTRVRSAHEIAERLDLPLLARLPEPPKKLRSRDSLVMVAEPSRVEAESFRMLRTSLEFVNLGREVRTIMVTSAVEREGKSTTAANLAVTLARAGKDVILVDLDLRVPDIERFFSPLRGRMGVTEAVLGETTVDQAMMHVDLESKEATGSLSVLCAGRVPPNPGELVLTAALGDLLGELRNRADVVIVDAPPLLHVGDAMALTPRVDGVLVVTRMETLRRPMLAELRRALDAAPTLKLGFVVTGAQAEEGYAEGYGYYSSYYRHHREERVS